MEAYGTAELIVVDNGSSDGTWEWMIEALSGRAVLVREYGVTISSLRNLGAARSTGEYISFIDSDCLVPRNYYQRVAEVFATVPTDVAGCMYGLPDDAHWIEETWMLLNCPLREGYATSLPGGSMVVRRTVFDRVGGFNEHLVTGEDAELCQRILDAGFKIYETHRLAIVHLRNMNSLRGFFRKQVWQSLGMFGTARSGRLDRVILMTLTHLILTLAAVVWIAVGAGPMYQRLMIAMALLLAVPAATVAYRVAARGGAFMPIRSTVLYSTYYYARIWGFFKILRGVRQ
jgi:glycosyltransferase involved in cell wall biosynthesis